MNARVKAPEVRLIGFDGKLVGVMSSRDALSLAKNQSMDLVEISPTSNPPTCKIMDYGKWKFETKKKEKQSRKNQVKVVIKEIQFRPRTGEGDVNIKLQKAREFLNNGCKVKVNLRFFGREMAHKEMGFKILQKVEKKLEDIAAVEMSAKMERRSLSVILVPIAMAKKKPEDKAQPIVEKKKPAAPEVTVTVTKKLSNPVLKPPSDS